MRPKAEFGLKCAAASCAMLGYLALGTTYLYGPQVILIPIAATLAMPIGERLDRKFKVYRLITTLIAYLYIALFAIIILRFSFLDAVLSLVMFIQLYSFVHLKQARHYAYILLMSFFLLWAAASESPRPDIAFVLFVYVFALGWAMTRLEMFVAETAVHEAGLPEAVARVQSLEPDRIRDVPTSRWRFSIAIVLVTVAAAVLGSGIFYFGPRTEVGVFGASQPRIQPTTGVSSEISLLESGALQGDSSPVMRVQFPDEPNGQFNGTMLWRVTALDAYTGDGWQHRGVIGRPGRRTNEEEQRRFSSDWRLASREGLDRLTNNQWPLVHQEIYLDRPPETAIPGLQLVKMIVAKDNPDDIVFRWDVAGDFSAVLTARTESGVYLDVYSEIMNPTPAQLRQSSTNYSATVGQQDLRNLTFQNLLPETFSLVRRVTDNAPTAYDKVRALEAYLSGSEFVYSTLIPQLPAENPIDAFILEEKQGHCELYASALALMVRSIGIPARVVTGYRDGMWHPNDRSYTITNDMAHLWTEVYFPGYGWITFDPSPTGDGEMALINQVWHEISRNLLKVRMLWLRYVVGFRPDADRLMLRDVATELIRSVGDAWSSMDQPRGSDARNRAARRPVMIAAAVAAAVGAALFVRRAWSLRAQTRHEALSADQRRAVRLRAQIVRSLRRWGVNCEGKTAEELAREAEALRLNDPAAAHTIIEAYNFTRFGNRPMNAEAYAAWRRRLRGVRRVAPEG